jgi:hypothetical protein
MKINNWFNASSTQKSVPSVERLLAQQESEFQIKHIKF